MINIKERSLGRLQTKVKLLEKSQKQKSIQKQSKEKVLKDVNDIYDEPFQFIHKIFVSNIWENIFFPLF